jgi:hypothetical protein
VSNYVELLLTSGHGGSGSTLQMNITTISRLSEDLEMLTKVGLLGTLGLGVLEVVVMIAHIYMKAVVYMYVCMRLFRYVYGIH